MNIFKIGNIKKQSIIIIFGDGIKFFLFFVSSIILARLISVNKMGTYRQIKYIAPLMVSTIDFGIGSTVYRFWNIFQDNKRIVYLKMVILLSILLGVIGSILLFILSEPISNWYNNPHLEYGLFIVIPFPLFIIPISFLRPLLISEKKALRATLYTILFSLFDVISIVIPIAYGFSLFFALRVWIATFLIKVIILIIEIYKYISQISKWWDNNLFSEVWEYLWPIHLGRFPGYITNYLDKIATSIYLSASGYAVYSMGARELPFIGSISYSISNVIIPNLVTDVEKGKYGRVAQRWRNVCEYTAMVTYPIAAFSIWYAVPIMKFLYSISYTDSSVPFRVFSAITFIRVVEYSSLAKSFGRSDIILKSSIIGAGSMLGLIFGLTKYLGVFGTAASVFISTLMTALYFLIKYRELLDVPLNTYFPIFRLIILFIFSFVSVFLGNLIWSPNLHVGNGSSMLIVGLKFTMLFFVVILIYLLLLAIMYHKEIYRIIKQFENNKIFN